MELLGRFGVDARLAIVPEERSDLKLHSLVEKVLSMGPNLGRQIALELVELVVADDLPFLERSPRCDVFCRRLLRGAEAGCRAQ